MLLFLAVLASFPPDGIRFLEQETRYAIPVGNNRVCGLSRNENRS
jgi:hypothetical protein